MPKKGSRSVRLVPGDISTPSSLGTLLRGYLEWLRVGNYSAETIKKRRSALSGFVMWAEERSLSRALEITRTVLEGYQRYLAREPEEEGARGLTVQAQHERLSAVRNWFRWMARQQVVLHNPASELELPKLGHHLPRSILSPSEVEDLLNLADVTTPLGLRDRAILETFYSTGIRRMELVRLQLTDLDAGRGVLTVRQGKGRKDRLVPIGERALAWTEKYRHDVRPRLQVREEEQTFFLTRLGDQFSGSSMSILVKDYLRLAELDKAGACHLLRHAMATGMHDNGADVRWIQSMLGHSRLSTTEIYTRVSIEKLKEVHRRTHPSGDCGGSGGNSTGSETP